MVPPPPNIQFSSVQLLSRIQLFATPWTVARMYVHKEIQPVHSEGDQPWDFFGRNDAKAETPTLWPPDAKS